MRHNPDAVAVLYDRLTAAYGKKVTAADRLRAIASWCGTLDGVPWLDIELAADAIAKEPGHYMPTAGDVRDRAIQMLRKRQPDSTPDKIVWHTESWSEGRDPDTGAPGLCGCGNLVTFTRQNGVTHASVAHRDTCKTATRKVSAA